MTSVAFEKPEGGRPCQGSFYKGIRLVVSVSVDSAGKIRDFDSFPYPYAVVLTQECDLTQDGDGREFLSGTITRNGTPESKSKKNIEAGRDKLLPSVLLCPAYPSHQFRLGAHLASIVTEGDPEVLKRELERYAVPGKSTKPFSRIKSNNDPRYHYLSGCKALHNIPSTILDFKHYFTLPTETLCSTYGGQSNYLARLKSPYREQVSQRFASFLARIGVAVMHKDIEPEA